MERGTDKPSELAATSLNMAPCYLNQLCIKHAPTTWLRKTTHLHVLSVKKIKEALTTRQWQPPRTMAPEGCLFGALSANSSSTASLASQIKRVFTATKLPSLPATLRELWYRVLVSGFVMGKHKTKEDARFCGRGERTCRTRSGRHYKDITHAFALCPLAASVWALALSWWSRRTGETLVSVSSPSNLVRVAILGFRDPASPPPPGSVFETQTSFAHLQEPWDFLRCCVLRVLYKERNRISLLPPTPSRPDRSPHQRFQLISPPTFQQRAAQFCYTS